MTKLQIQQIALNQIVKGNFGKVAVILEGRDTAGKTGTIRELTHYLPTSKYSVSLSSKPTEWDMQHWLPSWEKKSCQAIIKSYSSIEVGIQERWFKDLTDGAQKNNTMSSVQKCYNGKHDKMCSSSKSG